MPISEQSSSRGVQPCVSVVIPTYNRADLLPRALNSVLKQTFKDFEIVVIDDASTDTTPALVGSYAADQRIRYIRLEENGGVAAARNRGVAEARGRFVAFLDSDDAWEPEKLALQLEAVGSARDSARAVCYTAFFYHFGQGRKVKPDRGIRPGASLAEYLYCLHGAMQTSTVLVARDLALKAGFPGRGAEDTDYLLQLEELGAEFAFVPKPVSWYFADPRPGRLGPALPRTDLLRWCLSRPFRFSFRAVCGYQATVMVPMLVASGRPMDRIMAVPVFFICALLGRISAKAFVTGLPRVILPVDLYTWLQSVRYTLRPAVLKE